MPKSESSQPTAVNLIDGRLISIDSGTSTDERIRLIAEGQRGQIARRQLLAARIDANAIARRAHNGRLQRVHAGVYALPNTDGIPLATETAALLSCGEGAVLSHHSAAILWGLRLGVARPVHVTIPGCRHGATPTGVKVHRSVILAKADTRVHDGLPVTSAAPTLLDLAASLPDRDVERLVDEALFARRLVTRAQMTLVLKRAGAHPGRARLARVAGQRANPTTTESPPEEALYRLIQDAGLPEPELQATLLGYRLDFYWPKLGLAVEVDAYGTHGSPARFEADRRRDARLLTEMGIVVIRLTRDAVERRPVEVIALIARAIGRREARYDPARSRSR